MVVYDDNVNNKIYDNIDNKLSDLESHVKRLQNELDGVRQLVISHENDLKERKSITNTYVDTIMSKIDILKNIIRESIGEEEEFISQHMILVESIEQQIKTTGKISDKQFKLLNDIYLKQKRL